MNRSLYGERDYAFGKLILTLRTQIGLTQMGLAELLHVSRRAVTEWEGGLSYPTAEHLQQLIALGVRPRRSARCGKRHTRRCCLMKPGSPACSAARVLR